MYNNTILHITILNIYYNITNFILSNFDTKLL